MPSDQEVRRWQRRFDSKGAENERAAEHVRSLARSLLSRADLECTAHAREFLEEMLVWGIEPWRLRKVKELQTALEKPDCSKQEQVGFKTRLDGLQRIQAPTYRQVEWLLQINENNSWISTVGDGFSVPRLLPQIWRARSDLGDGDFEWIARLYEAGRTAIKIRHEGRFLRLARQLYLIEADDEAA